MLRQVLKQALRQALMAPPRVRQRMMRKVPQRMSSPPPAPLQAAWAGQRGAGAYRDSATILAVPANRIHLAQSRHVTDLEGELWIACKATNIRSSEWNEKAAHVHRLEPRGLAGS